MNMNNYKFRLAILAFLLCLIPAGTLSAAPILYLTTINTTAISGTTGFIEFGFMPGFGALDATVTIANFTPTASLLGTPVATPGVLGSLSSVLTIDNSAGFNDYSQAFQFGNSITFLLGFDGPALRTPDTGAPGDTLFSFWMLDSGGVNPALPPVGPQDVTFTINVNVDGTTTPQIYNPVVTLEVVATPEPSAFLLLGLGLAAVALRRARPSAARL